MDQEIKLKLCPFCGAEAKLCNSPLGYFVECVSLGHLHNSGVFDIFCFRKSPKQATEDWNRRVDNG